MKKLAINGFGRIGRLILRTALLNYPEAEIVAVNTSGSVDINGWAHLFRHDSVYGQFSQNVTVSKGVGPEIGRLQIGERLIPFLAQKEPAQIPWKDYQPTVILESTGAFCTTEKASGHLSAGGQKVVISAPAKDETTPSYLLGVNADSYQGETVISNGSCTTNSAAIVAKVIHQSLIIKKALMTTIHAYTSDQRLLDNSHRDLRRARSAALNIIPTTTGAAKAVISVLPELAGKFAATAVRVPVACGSLTDLAFLVEKETDTASVNALLKSQADNWLAVSDEPLVSTDIIGNKASAIVDLSLTQVIDKNFVKIFAWYDNEWAYSCRMVELGLQIA